MSLQKAIVVTKVIFLIALIGVATFYGQNSFVKKSIVTSFLTKEGSCKGNTGSQPINEEEVKHGNASDQRQNSDERDLNDFFATSLSAQNTKTDFTDLYHQFGFKEIHFEIITPPPEV